MLASAQEITRTEERLRKGVLCGGMAMAADDGGSGGGGCAAAAVPSTSKQAKRSAAARGGVGTATDRYVAAAFYESNQRCVSNHVGWVQQQ